MTQYNTRNGSRLSGLYRGDDGILQWWGGARYSDPKEAVKTHWAGNLRLGCTETTHGSGYYNGPCGNTAKHDPDANGNPTKCGVHSKAADEKRKAKRAAAFKKWTAESEANKLLRIATGGLEAVLRKIAAGDNDPRATAQEAITALDQAREAVARAKA